MRSLIVTLAVLALVACGGSTTAPPVVPPTTKGTVFFSLTNCQAYATAEYMADSTTVGTEAIVQGVVSKGYLVPVGRRMAVARVLKAGATTGLWTFKDLVTVSENNQVTARLAC